MYYKVFDQKPLKAIHRMQYKYRVKTIKLLKYYTDIICSPCMHYILNIGKAIQNSHHALHCSLGFPSKSEGAEANLAWPL